MPAQCRLRSLGAQLAPASAAGFVDPRINIGAKTIVLTGANRGLGLEFVRQYAACPAAVRLYACCRKPADASTQARPPPQPGLRGDFLTDSPVLQATELNEIAAASDGLITCHALDVTSAESVAALAAELDGVAIDVRILLFFLLILALCWPYIWSIVAQALINNSGVNPESGQTFLGDIDFDAWAATMDTNVYGVLRGASFPHDFH